MAKKSSKSTKLSTGLARDSKVEIFGGSLLPNRPKTDPDKKKK
jgi:hypothetical protein